MAEPTFVTYAESTFSDDGNIDETSGSFSWQAGDLVIVGGGISNNVTGNTLGTPTWSDATAFSLITSVNVNNDNNDTVLYAWKAVATSSGTGTVASVTATSASTLRSGIWVVVWRNHNNTGATNTIDGSSAKTISLTRTGTNSHVVVFMADWNQVGDVTVTATPTGTVRHASAQSGQADFFCCTYGDQGSTGTTSYGITNHTGTVDMTGIVLEILGIAGGGGGTQPPRSMHQFRMRIAA